MKLGRIATLVVVFAFATATAAFAQNTSEGQPGSSTVTHSSTGVTGGSQSSGQPVTHHKTMKHRPHAAHTRKHGSPT